MSIKCSNCGIKILADIYTKNPPKFQIVCNQCYTDNAALRQRLERLVEAAESSSKLLHSINWAEGTIPFKATTIIDKAIAATKEGLCKP